MARDQEIQSDLRVGVRPWFGLLGVRICDPDKDTTISSVTQSESRLAARASGAFRTRSTMTGRPNLPKYSTNLPSQINGQGPLDSSFAMRSQLPTAARLAHTTADGPRRQRPVRLPLNEVYRYLNRPVVPARWPRLQPNEPAKFRGPETRLGICLCLGCGLSRGSNQGGHSTVRVCDVREYLDLSQGATTSDGA